MGKNFIDSSFVLDKISIQKNGSERFQKASNSMMHEQNSSEVSERNQEEVKY